VYAMVEGGKFFWLTASRDVVSVKMRKQGDADPSIIRHIQLLRIVQLNPVYSEVTGEAHWRYPHLNPDLDGAPIVWETDSVSASLVKVVIQILQSSGVDYLLSGPLYLENAFLGGHVIQRWALVQGVSWQQHNILNFEEGSDGYVVRLRGNALNLRRKPWGLSQYVGSELDGKLDVASELGGKLGVVSELDGELDVALSKVLPGELVGSEGETVPIPMVHTVSSALSRRVLHGVKSVLRKHRLKSMVFYRSVNSLGSSLFTQKKFHGRLQEYIAGPESLVSLQRRAVSSTSILGVEGGVEDVALP
jgi:hypothetical protein